jgi:hypothetical protein
MDRETKRLAEQMIEIYGADALNDRDRNVDALADHGLPHERRDVDDFERHMRWLIEE